MLFSHSPHDDSVNGFMLHVQMKLYYSRSHVFHKANCIMYTYPQIQCFFHKSNGCVLLFRLPERFHYIGDLPYAQAQLECRKIGRRLPIIKSHNEHTELVNFIRNNIGFVPFTSVCMCVNSQQNSESYLSLSV